MDIFVAGVQAGAGDAVQDEAASVEGGFCGDWEEIPHASFHHARP